MNVQDMKTNYVLEGGSDLYRIEALRHQYFKLGKQQKNFGMFFMVMGVLLSLTIVALIIPLGPIALFYGIFSWRKGKKMMVSSEEAYLLRKEELEKTAAA